jgi:hypothetical protein
MDPSTTTQSPPRARRWLHAGFALVCVGFTIWVVVRWIGFRDLYAQQTEGWHVGSTKMLEVTLVRDDKKNLACASNRHFGRIHCAFDASGRPWGPGPEQDVHALQPYNTVGHELFLASGVWFSRALRGELPATRFTVVCNYHIKGVLKDVSLRWSPADPFEPVGQSLAVGTLTDCVMPE